MPPPPPALPSPSARSHLPRQRARAALQGSTKLFAHSLAPPLPRRIHDKACRARAHPPATAPIEVEVGANVRCNAPSRPQPLGEGAPPHLLLHSQCSARSRALSSSSSSSLLAAPTSTTGLDGRQMLSPKSPVLRALSGAACRLDSFDRRAYIYALLVGQRNLLLRQRTCVLVPFSNVRCQVRRDTRIDFDARPSLASPSVRGVMGTRWGGRRGPWERAARARSHGNPNVGFQHY